uniref:Uncharacterized protein n=1 Tax=Eutreptiella gymnastica TaxID=73025 RepID=A0A7S1IQ33_9EUGL|mmetsp:Transcript_34270/g.61439  ORF Transcript_34270/g.61439 Transcript_34270/m.61439 type:complete len:100 (+) Transcript_34270:269-568(+)
MGMLVLRDSTFLQSCNITDMQCKRTDLIIEKDAGLVSPRVLPTVQTPAPPPPPLFPAPPPCPPIPHTATPTAGPHIPGPRLPPAGAPTRALPYCHPAAP